MNKEAFLSAGPHSSSDEATLFGCTGGPLCLAEGATPPPHPRLWGSLPLAHQGAANKWPGRAHGPTRSLHPFPGKHTGWWTAELHLAGLQGPSTQKTFRNSALLQQVCQNGLGANRKGPGVSAMLELVWSICLNLSRAVEDTTHRPSYRGLDEPCFWVLAAPSSPMLVPMVQFSTPHSKAKLFGFFLPQLTFSVFWFLGKDACLCHLGKVLVRAHISASKAWSQASPTIKGSLTILGQY